MKLQYLAVIFVIIILPIVLILSQYVDYQIDAVNLRHTYNTKLIDATYDSIKAYQLNTINNAVSDIPGAKIEDLEAAVKTFFNSLSTTYGYTGYNASVMKNFIPAIVFTMYDGYYIYSPFDNTLTGVQKEQAAENGGTESYVAPEYVKSVGEDGKTLYGIKPYVYYSCRYKKGSDDFVITYTLDNYITIQGIIDGTYRNECGYLIDGIEKSGDSYTYDGVKYDESQKEKMVENLNGKTYSYVKINGTKYYLDETKKEVFYINASGERAVQSSKSLNESVYKEYKNKIEKNNSAYEYYKAAFEFTKKVRKDLKLGELTAGNAVDDNGQPISDFGEDLIFGKDNGNSDLTGDDTGNEWIQYSNSKFNQHRSAVIRYVVEKNLSAAISGYRQYNTSDTSIEYIMPKISETDWDKIENDVSIITFLQGFKIGGRDYNNYCVISNNLNKEHVDENDIYLIGDDSAYHKANEENLKVKDDTTQGIWKINFERKSYKEASGTDDNYQTVYYYPLKEIGSYSSIVASSKIKYEDSSENEYTDLYRYMKDSSTNGKVKKVYYTALARERWGAYSVNNSTDIVTPEDEDIPPTPEPTPEPTPDPEPATGTESITIDKVDEDGNKINNAWFWLTDKKENLNEESKILPQYRGGTGQGTNPSGQVIFNNLVSGKTYYIQEKYTPIEYKANEQIYEFKAGEKSNITITNKKIRRRTYR